MAKQIALFNHKGGVGKTTMTFNLGWMLAEKGKKVIIVDCDPQCNLTGMVLGFKDTKRFESIYESDGVTNIRDGLAPAFESRPALIEPVHCESIRGRMDVPLFLHLLPGHIGLAEYEITLGVAQELSGSLVTLQNLPGALHYLFSKTADKYDADFILVDMSPSLGPINQNLLMTSDYFIVPMFPDYFSTMATQSLASILPKWSDWARQAKKLPVLQQAIYPFPDKYPKFLGTIIQNYRIRHGNPSVAFGEWINKIKTGVQETLIPVLRENDMLLPDALYTEVRPIESQQTQFNFINPDFVNDTIISQPLLQVSDFNSLIALSQKHKTPIFDLSDEQIDQQGVILANTKRSMERFRDLFAVGAEQIIMLTDDG